MTNLVFSFILLLGLVLTACKPGGQGSSDNQKVPDVMIDSRSGMMAQIRDEGYNNSRVMDIAWHLTDVYGPRLANSPSYNEAANWAKEKFMEFGAENVKLHAFPGCGGMP